MERRCALARWGGAAGLVKSGGKPPHSKVGWARVELRRPRDAARRGRRVLYPFGLLTGGCGRSKPAPFAAKRKECGTRKGGDLAAVARLLTG
ncbi:MAG TPA: hypothetical protein VGD60_09980 [Candidatus Acidoferrales bacterium]